MNDYPECINIGRGTEYVPVELLKAEHARVDMLEEALREIIKDCEADYPPSHGAVKYLARAALADEVDT